MRVALLSLAFLSLVAIYLILQSLGQVFPFAGLTRFGLILVYLSAEAPLAMWLLFVMLMGLLVANLYHTGQEARVKDTNPD